MNHELPSESVTSESTPAQSDQTCWERWFHRLTWVAVLMLGAVAVSTNNAEPDLWGHVQYGRDLLAEGLPATTTYSYSVDDYRWINHENLAEVAFALGADTIGAVGMMVAKCLLGVGVLLLVMLHAKSRGAGLLTTAGVAVICALNLMYFWFLRPHTFTYIYFTLMLALLAWCFQGWEGSWQLPWPHDTSTQREQVRSPIMRFARTCWRCVLVFRNGDDGLPAAPPAYSPRRMRALWLAPVLFCLWANTHGGFVAGLVVFVVYLVLRGVEAYANRGRESTGLLARFGLMIAAAVLATFINPYGPRLHVWMLHSLGSPRPEITEWWPPNLLAADAYPIWLLLAFGGCAILLTRRSRDFTHLVVLALVTWQALSHLRHIPFLALLFAFWLPQHLESLLGRLRWFKGGEDLGSRSPAVRWAFAGTFGVCLAVLTIAIFERNRALRVDHEKFPVAAMQYIADQELSGKMVVTYNWAQYVIDAFGAEHPRDEGIRVSFDGRFRTCYPQEVVDVNFDLVLGDDPEKRFRGPTSPEFNPTLVLKYREPDLVLVSRLQKHSTRVMSGQADDWVLLYQDSLAQLWGRRSRYDDPQSPHYLPPAERRITEEVQEGFSNWPALPTYGRGRKLAANP